MLQRECPLFNRGRAGIFTLLAPPCRSPTLNHLHRATLTKDIIRAAMDDEGIIASLLHAVEQAYLARPHRADGHGHDLSRHFPSEWGLGTRFRKPEGARCNEDQIVSTVRWPTKRPTLRARRKQSNEPHAQRSKSPKCSDVTPLLATPNR